MSAITERVAAGAAFLDDEGCDAIGMLLGIDLGRCNQTPALPYTGACEHEHVKERLLCAFHASRPEAAVCRRCYELPEPHAHECPIALTPGRSA